MSSRKCDPREFRDRIMHGNDTSSTAREYKFTPSPPPGSLEEILRGWRSPQTENHYDDNNQDEQEDDSMDDGAKSVGGDRTVSPESAKRSRYLREADRRAIIQRIDSGEKQVELAREFGVTRAAVCHINKNRAEILARSTRPDVHAAARHPKRRMAKTLIVQRRHLRQQQQLDEHVYRVRSPALANHMTTLRNKATDSRAFRATADRAFRLLIEEALASASTSAFSHQQPAEGLLDWPTCAMVMSERGFPLLTAFQSVQPDSPAGFITLVYNDDDELILRKMSAPLNLRDQRVFLLTTTCTTALEVSTAIQAMLDFGACETSINLVTLVISAAVVVEIHEQYPNVRIVAAAVDHAADPGVGNFLERYFNTTTIHQSGLGSTVNI